MRPNPTSSSLPRARSAAFMPCQRRVSCRIHSEKSGNCAEHHSWQLQGRREEAFVPWLFLHLSKLARQSMKEKELLTGPLDSTNEWYAVAKIAGLK